MDPDSTLAQIREVRHQISEKCGHDPKRLIEHYMEIQQQYRDRLVWSSDSASGDEVPDAEPEGKDK